MRIAYVNARYRLDTHDGPNAHSRQFVENAVALGHDVWMCPGQEHPLARRLPRSRLARVRALRTMDAVYVRLEHGRPSPCRWAVGVRRALLGDPLMVWEFNTVPEFGTYVDEAPSRIARNIEGFRHFGRGCDLAVCVSPHLAEYVARPTRHRAHAGGPQRIRSRSLPARCADRPAPPRRGPSGLPRAVDGQRLRPLARLRPAEGRRRDHLAPRDDAHHIAVHLIGKEMRLIREMPPNVRYHGMEEYQHLPGWMSAMHVGLCLYRPGPADYSSPLKLFDYLSSGLAVVATRQPQTAEILGELDTPDLLIAPRDAQGLADRLEALAGDRERVRQIGRRARDLLVRKYTWRGTVTAALAEIERLASTRGRAARRAGEPGPAAAGPIGRGGNARRQRRRAGAGERLHRDVPTARVARTTARGAHPARPRYPCLRGRRRRQRRRRLGRAGGRVVLRPAALAARRRAPAERRARTQPDRRDGPRRFVAFIDDDEVPDPRWLAELHAAVVSHRRRWRLRAGGGALRRRRSGLDPPQLLLRGLRAAHGRHGAVVAGPARATRSSAARRSGIRRSRSTRASARRAGRTPISSTA